MSTLEQMLQTHPQRPHSHFDVIAACLTSCFETEHICATCADACLGEEKVAALRQCIRLNHDCADLCGATGRLIARQAQPDAQLWRLTLEACIQACRSCAAECARHEKEHEHCRICKESCERTERACRALLAALPTGGAKEVRH